MKLVVFDVSGKFAHFRKYYTNSSSLTYFIPPRTAVCGLIAGILGYERDSYYEIFDTEKAKISVRILSKNRRIMQSVNYLKVESTSNFYAPMNHTQIPFEIIASDKMIAYRIFFMHEDDSIIDKLTERIKEKKYYYSPYLGAAPFGCSINYIDVNSFECKKQDSNVEINSVVKADAIVSGSVDLVSKPLSLLRENMPRSFDRDRYLKESAPYIYDENGESINMQVNEEVLNVKYDSSYDNVVFM